MITSLKPFECFVFGSNLAGKHYGGAAVQARGWGAIDGLAIGKYGNTYAIPTLDENFQKLPLENIKYYLEDFAEYAKNNGEWLFLLTKIGEGIAGFEPEEMESIMPNFPSNVIKV